MRCVQQLLGAPHAANEVVCRFRRAARWQDGVRLPCRIVRHRRGGAGPRQNLGVRVQWAALPIEKQFCRRCGRNSDSQIGSACSPTIIESELSSTTSSQESLQASQSAAGLSNEEFPEDGSASISSEPETDHAGREPKFAQAQKAAAIELNPRSTHRGHHEGSVLPGRG